MSDNRVIDISDSRDNNIKGECVATIGFFDGVHRGHRFLIDQVRSLAEKKGLASAVVTFLEHPLSVLRPDAKPTLLTPGLEKTTLLRASGVDIVALCKFDKRFSETPPYEFMKTYLRDRLHVSHLIIGYDHHFGHDRTKGFDDYAEYGKELGISVVKSEEYRDGDTGKIASSTIRTALLSGNTSAAETMLGYPYFICGTIVNGFHIGRQIGYPTANIRPDSESKLIPGNGAYAVRAQVNGSQYSGMMNIGTRPTIGNGTQRSIEVHLLDYSGDLYSEHVKIEFVDKLRDERKFDSVELLRKQLRKDETACRELFMRKD